MTNSIGDVFELKQKESDYYFGSDESGRLCVLIPLELQRFPADRQSGSVSLFFRPLVTFRVSDQDEESAAAVLRCERSDLEQTFKVLTKDVVGQYKASDSDPRRMVQALLAWEELLRYRRQLTRDQEIGLWGELWTLLSFPDIDRALSAWGGPDAEKIDFFSNGIGLECKTSKAPLQHHFSQEQLTRPLGDADVYVISLWVAHDPVEGRSIESLVREIDSRVADSVLFETKLLETGFSREDAALYELRLRVLEQPKLFAISDVPRVLEASPGVTRIHFVSTLDADLALPADSAMKLLGTICGD